MRFLCRIFAIYAKRNISLVDKIFKIGLMCIVLFVRINIDKNVFFIDNSTHINDVKGG